MSNHQHAEQCQNNYPFCSVSELKRQKRITKWMDEFRDEVSAFYLNDTISVMSTVCPHFGGEFRLDPKRCVLKCCWHGWEFEISSGKCLTFPIKGNLEKYDFQIQEDTLLVSRREDH